MSSPTAAAGKVGEDLAVSYLEARDYKILERNFKKRYGEIDIIALESEILVFVEVKTRFSPEFGPPEEAVTPWKLRQIEKTSQFYKMLHPELPEALRIDVIAVELGSDNQAKEIRHIKNAYTKGLG
jgi:putative endonuclease